MLGNAAPAQHDTAMPAASILIVNYNAGPHLARCVAALLAQDNADFEVFLLDNGSADRSFELARAAAGEDARFHFEAAGANLGFAAGNNRLAARASADWLAFLNPDAFPAPDWLSCMLAAAATHPEVALFGSLQLDAGDAARLDGAGDRYLFAGLPWRGGYGWPSATALAEGAVFSPCAAAALVRRDAFQAVGGFDERFFCYVEDVDLGFRLRLAGQQARQIVAARVQHVGGASSAGAGSAFARYHGMRNVVWCFVKNMPGPLFWPLLPLHLAVLLLLWLRAIPRGMAGVVGRALCDALLGLGPIWASRRVIQAGRRAPLGSIIRALTWNPLEYARRAPANRLSK